MDEGTTVKGRREVYAYIYIYSLSEREGRNLLLVS